MPSFGADLPRSCQANDIIPRTFAIFYCQIAIAAKYYSPTTSVRIMIDRHCGAHKKTGTGAASPRLPPPFCFVADRMNERLRRSLFPPAPSYPIVDRLTDGSAVVDLRQMAPLRLFAAQTHQQAPRCPRSVNGVRPFAPPLACASCSLISRPPAASSSSSVPHGYRLIFAVPVLSSDHAIPLSLPPDHGRRKPPSPYSSQGAHRPLRPPLPHPPGSCLAACSGLHRLFCSPPYPAAHTDQSNKLAPLQARSPALCSPCSIP